MIRIIVILLCLTPILASKAQPVQGLYNEQMRIENKSVTRSNDNRLTIAMDIVLQPNLKISSNEALQITPVLQTDKFNKVLPEIHLYGRQRELFNRRNRKMPKEAYRVVRHKPKKEQTISYLVQLPYEAWMQSAYLRLDIDASGCCDALMGAAVQEQIHRLSIELPEPQLSVAYIAPRAEAIKHRAAQGKAYLDFPVNRIDVSPNYRNNNTELAKIRATIDTIRNDKNTSITAISIEGYASPEGSYAINEKLAKGRTQALAQYVRNYYKFDEKIMKTTSIAEDWEGYKKFIEASNIDKKSEVLQLIENTSLDYDLKEKRIAALVGPQVYKFILSECFPALRHSDYVVNYTVRGFTLEEAKEVIKTHPQQLSLQEIFNVAQSYEQGSEEFNHAFLVAALMFPNDETANLNAAAMEIQKGGDLTVAKKYLAKANPEHSATLNNLGVIAMREGNLTAAEELFKKAAANSEANSNLLEVEKQKNYPVE